MPPAPSGRLSRAVRAGLVVALGLGAACAPALAADAPTGNLAPSASFERGTSGWTPVGGRLSRVRAGDAPDGRRVARLARAAGAGAISLVAARLRADTGRGRVYRAEAWVRADGAGSVGAPATLAVVQRARDGRVTRRWTSPRVALRRGFRRLAVVARPRARGGRLEVVVTQPRARRGDAIAVDAVRLVRRGVRASGADGAGINGSFEAGTGGWGGWSAALSRVARSDAPDGAHVVRVVRTGSGSSYALQESTRVGPLGVGARYGAGIWVRAGGASSAGRPIQIKLRERNRSGVVVADTASAPVALTASWRRITVSAATRVAGGTLDLRVSQSEAARGHSFLADAATLAEATAGTAPAPAPPPAAPPATPAPAPPAVPFDGGLLPNASFEGADGGWTGYGAVVASVPVADAPHGAYAIRATNAGTLGYFTLNPPAASAVSTVAGTTYAAEAWVRAASPSSLGRPIQLKLRERTPAGTVVADAASPVSSLAGTWQRIAVTRTAAGTGNALDLRVSQSDAGPGDAFLVDAARLTASGPAPAPAPVPTPIPVPAPVPEPAPAPPPSADHAGPVVAFASPAAGASVSGAVAVAATATDPSGVARVEFRADGAALGTVTAPPYSVSWDTSALAPGAHSLAATAVDALGNATTVTRAVTVADPVPAPVPAPPPSAGGDLFANPWPSAAVRQPIPAGEPTDVDSPAMVSALMGVSKNIGGSNSPTRLQGGPGDPVYTGIDGTRVYIHGAPAGGGGADDTMEVYNAVAPDGSANLVTRYWTDGSLTFADGRIGSSTTGAARLDGDGTPFRGNGTAWGLFSSVGVVLHEELEAGVIPHAVGIALGNNILSRSFRAPARSSESKATGSTVPMGVRFQITMPWEQIEATLRARFTGDTLGAALVFWRALKDYGAIVRDGTGSNGSWWYTDATGMPPGIDWSGIVRVPALWSASSWRVPARSAY